jgi:excisionase family DNA binding protein
MSSPSRSYRYEALSASRNEGGANSATAAASIPDPLLDSTQAAAFMKIHPKTLQKLARRGVVRGIHVGKLWRFRASAIEEWIDSQ